MNRADEIELAKRRVEACFEDYRRALLAYAEWVDAYRKRQAEKTEAA